jgi:hypothetical protein
VSLGFGSLQGDVERTSLRLWELKVHAFGDLTEEFGQTSEGEPAVERGRHHRQDPTAAALGQLTGDLEQAALPDPGLAVCDCAPTVGQEGVGDAEIVLSTEQAEGGGRSLVHLGIMLHPG